jgi:hypothetical protein
MLSDYILEPIPKLKPNKCELSFNLLFNLTARSIILRLIVDGRHSSLFTARQLMHIFKFCY